MVNNKYLIFTQRKLYLQNLIGYFKFDDATLKTYDSINKISIGVQLGAPVIEEGKVGLCCTFNNQQTGFRASGNWLLYDMNSGDGVTPAPFSIGCWLKIASPANRPVNNTNGHIFGLIGRTGGAKDQYYAQYRTTIGNIVYEDFRFVKVDGERNTVRAVKLDFSLPYDEWVFVMYVDSGIGTEKIYVNGEEKPILITDNGYVSMINSTTPYGPAISALSAGNYVSYFFPGSIDEIMIFKYRALPPEDILDIYNYGEGKDLLY